MTRDNDLSVPQIAAMLAEQAEAVYDHYLGNGLLVSGCSLQDWLHEECLEARGRLIAGIRASFKVV